MRLFLIFIVFASVLFFGCEENFSPKGDFVPKYALNCIIRGDTTVQTAVIMKSYNVSGFNPYDNQESPYISNADVRLWRNNDVFFFSDSTINSPISTRFLGPTGFYYTDEFKPGSRDNLEIRAVLSDGKVLSGTTRLPEEVEWNIELNSRVAPDTGNSYITFSWKKGFAAGWFLPKLYIIYSYTKDGETLRAKQEVAHGYDNKNGQLMPIAVSPTKFESVIYSNAFIDSAMASIAGSDPNKNNYTIFSLVLELLVFDENLSKYYSSLNGFLDDFTVRVDEADYSNIEGGFGIFGSFIKQMRGLRISTDYIKSYGYIPANP